MKEEFHCIKCKKEIDIDNDDEFEFDWDTDVWCISCIAQSAEKPSI